MIIKNNGERRGEERERAREREIKHTTHANEIKHIQQTLIIFSIRVNRPRVVRGTG